MFLCLQSITLFETVSSGTGPLRELTFYALWQVLEEVKGTNPAWYALLTSSLSVDQQKALSDVMVLADQRRAAAESKRIEEAGGKPRTF